MRIKAALAMMLLLACPTPAMALLCGTFLDPMTVTATTLNFGNYFPASASTATMTVNVNCGLGADVLPAFTIALSSGNSPSPTTRYLDKSGTHMNYNIYTTSGYANILADGTAGTVLGSYAGLLSIGTLSFTGYGQIPAGQYLPAGTYIDHLTVTVSY